jgi:glycosyltransferase involved in cell wall biosynthesis
VAEVLLVSKPLAAPWTDSAKNLVHTLVTQATGLHHFHCFVPSGGHLPLPNVTCEAIYASAGAYAPGIGQNMRVFRRLMRADTQSIYHFFFAANPRTNRMIKWALMLKGKRKLIHTVLSQPSGNVPWFADVHVTLSEHTRERLIQSGARDVRLIRPGIVHLDPLTPEEKAKARRRDGLPEKGAVVLFAGDLVAGGGAEVMANVALRLKREITVAFACRDKGEGHQQRRIELAAKLGRRVHWLGQVADMPTLAGAVDLQCLPATNLWGKMDLPMVLIEGMCRGVPAMITRVPPLAELGGEEDGVIHVAPGDPDQMAAKIEALLADRESLLRLSKAAGSRATARFSAQAMVTAYDQLYTELSHE